MPLLSPEERTLRARIAAFTLHATHDSTSLTERARQAAKSALDVKLLEQVDPDGALPDGERERRLAHARRAHFSRLAFKSVKARKKGGRS